MTQVIDHRIDLAKHSFQLHGAGKDGSVVFRKKLRRGNLVTFLTEQPKCLIAMEACASAHFWGREIAQLGDQVKLVSPIYVKPFVKRLRTMRQMRKRLRRPPPGRPCTSSR